MTSVRRQVLASLVVSLGLSQQAFGLPYSAEVLGDSPIGYWRFEETSGTNAADSAGSNDGTWIGATQGNLSATAALANAAGFNGVDSRINLPALGNVTNLSIEAWFKASTLPGIGEWAVLYDTQFFSPNALHWQLFTNGAGQTTNELALGFSDTTNTFSFAANTWYHLVATYDNSSGTGLLYVNGSLVETLFTGETPHITILSIGDVGAWTPVPGSPARVFDGLIDEVAIYDQTLSAAQIAAHYRAAFATVPEPTTFALLAVAGLTAFGVRRRRIAP